jgi:urease accessory protein
MSSLEVGAGAVAVEYVAGASALVQLASRSPLKLIPTAVRGTCVQVSAATFGGGLVAGDRVALTLRVGEGGNLHVGTAAPTKVYRSPAQRTATFRLHAQVAKGGLLIHTPGALCCFNQARYHQAQRVDLEEGGSLVLVDILTSGRSARGERWAFDEYVSRTEILVGGRLSLNDGLALRPVPSPVGERMGRFDALATVVMLGPRVSATAGTLRATIDARPVRRADTLLASASPLRDGVIVRVAAESVEAVELLLRELLGKSLQAVIGADPWRARW